MWLKRSIWRCSCSASTDEMGRRDQRRLSVERHVYDTPIDSDMNRLARIVSATRVISDTPGMFAYWLEKFKVLCICLLGNLYIIHLNSVFLRCGWNQWLIVYFVYTSNSHAEKDSRYQKNYFISHIKSNNLSWLLTTL